MARIKILQAVAGDDFSWIPGEVVDLPDERAAVWADGYRAEWVDAPPETPAQPREPEPAEEKATVVEDGAEKAAVRSRGGGRARRTETRGK